MKPINICRRMLYRLRRFELCVTSVVLRISSFKIENTLLNRRKITYNFVFLQPILHVLVRDARDKSL